MKPKTSLLILLLTGILSGCYTPSQLEFDGLKPAEIYIPASVQRLTVVARCDLDSSYRESLVIYGRKSDFIRDSIIAKQAVLGCSDALLESPRFALFNPVVHRSLGEEHTNPEVKLPWSTVLTIAGDPPCDAVLSLEHGKVGDSVVRVVEDGWQVYYYVIYVNTSWRLYRLSDFQSTDYVFVDTIRYEIDPPTLYPLVADQKVELLRSAMYDAGVQTARRLAPWWTIIERYYFSMGPNGFARASAYLQAGKWQEAAEIWRPMTEVRQKKVAAKACFNMAITCELANNIPAAFDWLRKSEKLGIPIPYIKDYQAKLAKRDLESSKLDQQLN